MRQLQYKNGRKTRMWGTEKWKTNTRRNNKQKVSSFLDSLRNETRKKGAGSKRVEKKEERVEKKEEEWWRRKRKISRVGEKMMIYFVPPFDFVSSLSRSFLSSISFIPHCLSLFLLSFLSIFLFSFLHFFFFLPRGCIINLKCSLFFVFFPLTFLPFLSFVINKRNWTSEGYKWEEREPVFKRREFETGTKKRK